MSVLPADLFPGALVSDKSRRFGEHANATLVHEAAIVEEVLSQHLDQVASQWGKNATQHVGYLLGMGAQERALYRRLNAMQGLEVCWSRSIIADPWRWFLPFVPSQMGLIKVHEPALLKSSFRAMTEQSMAIFYLMDPSAEFDFLARCRWPLPEDHSFGILSGERNFILLADCDNQASATGIVEVVFAGRESPVRVVATG